MMKLSRCNYYGFIHSEVAKKFGPCTFLNSFCLEGEERPVTLYKAHEPDRALGHKSYFLLQVVERLTGFGGYGIEEIIVIRGMELKDLLKHRFQDAIHCFKCDNVIFSVTRHDMRMCACQSVFIDGGKEYTHAGGPGLAHDSEFVTVDFVADLVVLDIEKEIMDL